MKIRLKQILSYILDVKNRALLIFLCVFIFSISVQTYIWTNIDSVLVDKTIWTDAIQTVGTGETIGPESVLYGYPALTILSIGKFIIMLGFSSSFAYFSILIFFLSLGMASISSFIYIIEPKKPWWITSIGLVIFSPYIPNATPPSIVISTLIPLMILLVLYINVSKNINYTLYIFGIVVGLALSTRIDITLAFFGMSLLFLINKIGKNILKPIIISFLIFCVLSFYINNEPFGYFYGSFIKSRLAYSGYFGETSYSLLGIPLFSYSLLALTSYMTALFMLLFEIPVRSIPRNYFVWILTSTFLIGGIILSSSYHPMWYFIPLIISWEIFLPILLMSLVDRAYEHLENEKRKNWLIYLITIFMTFVHLGPFFILFFS